MNRRTGLGRHFIIGLRPSLDLHADDRKLLNALQPAGIAVFRKNFEHGASYASWHARFVKLLTAARDAIGRNESLVCIDHEGGTVVRTPAPLTAYAFARVWAGDAGPVGQAMGVELASLGVNVNFAPVLDIDSNPNNPVIGPRAFGSTPLEVERAGMDFISALQREGVLACPKHFPGHGDTHRDSHYDLPVLDAELQALQARELRPFVAAIRSGVSLMMTAHIRYPRIDPDHCATMSRVLVADLLRQQLGYQGVVVTDDIGMGAVSSRFENRTACADVLRSGTDLVMICSHWTNTDRAYQMVDDLERSVRDGYLETETLEASDRRLAALLARLPQSNPRLLDAELLAKHASVAPLRDREGGAGEWVSLG